VKLKTQFVLAILVFGVTVLLIAASVIYANIEVERLDGQLELATRIERGVSELSYLSNDYLLYGENRQHLRWESKWLSLSKDLSALNPRTSEQLTMARHLNEDLRRLKAVFTDVSERDSGTGAARDIGAQESIRVSWSRMAVQNQETAFDALRLSRALSDQKSELAQTTTILILILMAAFFAFFISNYLFVSRRTLKGISKLRTGTKVIGSGNLDYELKAKRNDEIGDLARSFNLMTANLKMITSSKADLEIEIAERKNAEEALRLSEAKYRSLFESMVDGIAYHKIITDEHDKPVDYVFLEVNSAFEELTGLKATNIIGKRVTEVLPGIEKDPAGWIETYGRVALTREAIRFEQYAEALNRWYDVSAYCPEKGYFVTVFEDISERKHSESELRHLYTKLEERVAERTAKLSESESHLKRLSGQLISAQEVERQRIGRELHDGVGQLLAAAKFRIEKTLHDMKDQGNDTSYLEAVVPILQECVKEVRRVQRDLHPPSLEALGIIPTLQAFCRDFAENYPNIAVEHTLKLDETKLSGQQKTAIYRVAQEAMNNIAKHSGADKANVMLTRVKGTVRLSVKDNGKGFDPAEMTGTSSSSGLGLSSMRERVEPGGGSLLIKSIPGKGTTILATWPIVS
jgi:PAS domain S-box-containing protein